MTFKCQLIAFVDVVYNMTCKIKLKETEIDTDDQLFLL